MATTENGDAARTDLLDRELAGLDQLETALPSRPSQAARIWAGAWPKLLAVALVLIVWQLIVWSHWKPDYILPCPRTVAKAFWDGLLRGNLLHATAMVVDPKLIVV